MSGRKFARRNLFSKLLAWLLSFHFQFSLQGGKTKIITLNNNLQKTNKQKKRVLAFLLRWKRAFWTELKWVQLCTSPGLIILMRLKTTLAWHFSYKKKKKKCAFQPSYLDLWCKIYRCMKWGTDSGTVVNIWKLQTAPIEGTALPLWYFISIKIETSWGGRHLKNEKWNKLKWCEILN